VSVLHVVSVSGGKDSAATAILALETMPRESLRFAFCDTGNEHESTPEWVAYMAKHLGIEIATLRADLTGEVIRRRDYVREHWPREKGLAQADIDRAVAALVPTGNPFLDLCLWKGRFPSRRAQFCTEFLKTRPMVEVLEISKRFPRHIDRIAYWEACVKAAAKLRDASFFPDPHRDAHLNKRGIHNVVEWSKTQRGGVNLDWIRITEEPKACESAYGLCE